MANTEPKANHDNQGWPCHPRKDLKKMSTEKLILAIAKSLEKAAGTATDGNNKEAEEILKYTLFRWLRVRPLTLHTEN